MVTYRVIMETIITEHNLKHDDTVDALSYQGILIDKMTEGLTQEEITEEEYDREYESSGWSDLGRDELTGY